MQRLPPRLLIPRLVLETHYQGSNFADRSFQPAWANLPYQVYVAIMGLRNA
jgi:hypothetical protein